MEISVDQLEETNRKWKYSKWANKRKLAESSSYGYEIPGWDQAGKLKDRVESSERCCNDSTCSFWLLLSNPTYLSLINISAKEFPSKLS